MSLKLSGEPISTLLADSFDILERQHPDGYRVIRAELGDIVVEVAVDDEAFVVRNHSDTLEITQGGSQTGDITIATDRRTIDDVLESRLSLAAAARLDRLRVTGPLEAIVRVHDALIEFVRCMAMLPARRGLMDRF